MPRPKTGTREKVNDANDHNSVSRSESRMDSAPRTSKRFKPMKWDNPNLKPMATMGKLRLPDEIADYIKAQGYTARWVKDEGFRINDAEKKNWRVLELPKDLRDQFKGNISMATEDVSDEGAAYVRKPGSSNDEQFLYLMVQPEDTYTKRKRNERKEKMKDLNESINPKGEGFYEKKEHDVDLDRRRSKE